MASVLSITRDRVKTILGTVTGLSASRIKLGTVDFSASTEFLNTIVSGGPYVIVGKPSRTASLSGGIYEWELPLKYYHGYADDADNDYKAIDDILELARSALNTFTNYTDCAMPTGEVSIDSPEELSEKPRVVMHEITLRGMAADLP